MADRSGRKIITNRQLNFTLCPVDLYNKKSMPYNLSDYAIDGTWNNHQSIVLDLLLDQIFFLFYKNLNGIPKSWRSEKALNGYSIFYGEYLTPENLAYMTQSPLDVYRDYQGIDLFKLNKEIYEHSTGISNENDSGFQAFFKDKLEKDIYYNNFVDSMNKKLAYLDSNAPFTFSLSFLSKNCPFFGNYRYTLQDIFKKISQTKFKMNLKLKRIEKNPVRSEPGRLTERGILGDLYYSMKDFQPIFELNIDKEIFHFNFKSPFGKMILHNTFILDTDWMLAEVMELNKTAYFIYKRFVLNRVSGKNKPKTIELWFDEIKKFLDLKWSNNPAVHRSFDKAFKEIQQQGLVDDYSWNKKYAGQRQYQLNWNRGAIRSWKKSEVVAMEP